MESYIDVDIANDCNFPQDVDVRQVCEDLLCTSRPSDDEEIEDEDEEIEVEVEDDDEGVTVGEEVELEGGDDEEDRPDLASEQVADWEIDPDLDEEKAQITKRLLTKCCTSNCQEQISPAEILDRRLQMRAYNQGECTIDHEII